MVFLKGFLRNVSIRKLINGVIIILSLLCLLSAGVLGWDAYKERNTALSLSRLNEMADIIIVAAAQEARERGLTATALSSNGTVSPDMVSKINKFRTEGDDQLNKALAIAKEIADDEPQSTFTAALEQTNHAYKTLIEARKKVDSSLVSEERVIETPEWLKTATALIESAARLRQTAFMSSKPLEQITQNNLILKQAVWLISENMGKERATIGSSISSGKPIQPSTMDKLTSFHAVVELGISDILAIKGHKGIDSRILESVNSMEKSLDHFNETRNAVYAAGETGNYPIDGQEWFNQATDTIDMVLAVSTAVTEVSHKKAEEITRQDLWVMLLIFAGIICTVVFIGIVLFLVHEKTNQIERLRESMFRLSEGEGDLTFRLDAKSGDEIGQTAAAFNSFMGQLYNIVSQIKKATDQAAAAAVELSATAEQMESGSVNQSQQSVQAASAIEEMSASVVEVAKNVGEIAKFSKNANETADKGGKVVEATVQGMQKIAISVKSAASVIETLGTSSEQIGEIVSVIDNIAEQTNLLALNAAIEAARASEQGRGFAVVADEVRKLAERTTKATAEISSTIKTIQTDIHKAVGTMNEGTTEVEAGVKLANEAGQALRQVVEGSQKVTDMIMQIATAAEQQSSVSSEISGNVEKISNLSQENKAAASQTASAADDLLNLATGLQQMVSRFKV